MSMARQSSSVLMAIATAANQIVCHSRNFCFAGGLEQISLVQNEHRNSFRTEDPMVLDLSPHLYMPMIDTAEIVAKRYGVSREAQDEYGAPSQARPAAAPQDRRFADQIGPGTGTTIVARTATGHQHQHQG